MSLPLLQHRRFPRWRGYWLAECGQSSAGVYVNKHSRTGLYETAESVLDEFQEAVAWDRRDVFEVRA